MAAPIPKIMNAPRVDSYDASYQRCPPKRRIGQQSCQRCPLRSSIVRQSHICRRVAILSALQVNLVTTEPSFIGAPFSVLSPVEACDCTAVGSLSKNVIGRCCRGCSDLDVTVVESHIRSGSAERCSAGSLNSFRRQCYED
jgi:hypothetical protein